MPSDNNKFGGTPGREKGSFGGDRRNGQQGRYNNNTSNNNGKNGWKQASNNAQRGDRKNNEFARYDDNARRDNQDKTTPHKNNYAPNKNYDKHNDQKNQYGKSGNYTRGDERKNNYTKSNNFKGNPRKQDNKQFSQQNKRPHNEQLPAKDMKNTMEPDSVAADAYDNADIKEASDTADSFIPSSYNQGLNTKKAEGVAAEGAIFGRNAVKELLAANRAVDKIFVLRGARDGSIVVLIAESRSRGIPVVDVERGKLDMLSGGANHQGIVAMAPEREYSTIDDILQIAADRGERPLIVIADRIEDPHNLGALIRSAECSGAHGVIIPKRRASGLSPLASKASAGAVEHIAVAKVTNIAVAVDELKEKGLWIFAAEVGGEEYYKTDFSVPAAIIFGSEGGGVSRLVKEKSDYIVSIPMYGRVNSLNVSAAAAVILSEAARQQRTGGSRLL